MPNQKIEKYFRVAAKNSHCDVVLLMKTKKPYKIALIVVLIAWLLTLGVHIEYEMTSSCSTPENNTWWTFLQRGIRGDGAQLYSSASLHASRWSALGVPFVFHVRRDVPPYDLNLSRFASIKSPRKTMQITSLDLVFDSGEKATIPLHADESSAHFQHDSMIIGGDDVPFQRCDFVFPGVIEYNQSFWVSVNARHSGGSSDDHTQRIRVEPGHMRYVSIGWFLLILWASGV